MTRDTRVTDQVQIALFFLRPCWNSILTVGYVAFDIWAWSIKQRFTSENRMTGARTATAVLAFLLLSTIVCGTRAIDGWGRFLLCAPIKKKESVSSVSSFTLCLTIILVLILVAPAVFMCVVAWKWFSEFHANGEETNATYSAVLGIISAISLVLEVVGMTIALVVYCA